MIDKKNYSKGLKNRKKVLGEKYVNNTLKNKNIFNKDFQEFITDYCWHQVWDKKHLSHKQKSFNNLCILASTNKWPEFKLHLKGAINNGCNLNELKELFLQIAVYCGVPTGVECFKNAEEFFKSANIDITKEIS